MNPQKFPVYFPYQPEASSYVLTAPDLSAGPNGGRPVPPREAWISEKYGNTPEEYLASGQRDMQQMLQILDAAAVSLESVGNILEFGCGDGRMIRFLEHLAQEPEREIWGTDIDAGRIFWCKQHLSPPFHFATTTTVPHLPFADGHFGFIYAGSVFTHIDDLADAWIAELRRILAPGGKLFITVHLKNDIPLIQEKYPQSGLARLLQQHSELLRADFDMLTIGRSAHSYVFYDWEYLRKSIEPMYRVLSITEEVRLYQDALLLERA